MSLYIINKILNEISTKNKIQKEMCLLKKDVVYVIIIIENCRYLLSFDFTTEVIYE